MSRARAEGPAADQQRGLNRAPTFAGRRSRGVARGGRVRGRGGGALGAGRGGETERGCTEARRLQLQLGRAGLARDSVTGGDVTRDAHGLLIEGWERTLECDLRAPLFVPSPAFESEQRPSPPPSSANSPSQPSRACLALRRRTSLTPPPCSAVPPPVGHRHQHPRTPPPSRPEHVCPASRIDQVSVNGLAFGAFLDACCLLTRPCSPLFVLPLSFPPARHSPPPQWLTPPPRPTPASPSSPPTPPSPP